MVRNIHLNREIQCLASLRKAIIKQRDWEKKNQENLIRGSKTKLVNNYQKRFAEAIKDIDEAGLERLTIAANKFLELAEQNAILVDPDGEG
jgi:hypothetical protein